MCGYNPISKFCMSIFKTNIVRNIFVLPTDNYKNVRLSLFNDKLYLGDVASTSKPQNIYITSDDYIGYSYYLDGGLVRKGVIDDKEYWEVRKEYKKIIMTTDPELIKDRVQEIPEDFLKWLVDNPDCEYVEVEKKGRCCGRCNGVDDLCYTDMCCDDHHEYGCEECYGRRVYYEIIIPEKCTCEVGHPYNNLCCKIHGKIDNDDDGLVEIKEPIGKFIIENATPVQGNDGAYFHYSDVCKLLKLQQKNMITKENVKNTLYNDDEVKLILGKLMGDIFRGKGVHLNEWFEENKKK